MNFRTVHVELLEDDVQEMEALLAARGRSGGEGFGWLLVRGTDLFSADQRDWDGLSERSDAEAEARKLDLKRRETRALVVNMRLRTWRTEGRKDSLDEEVSALAKEYRRLRLTLWHLKQERDRLLARLRAAGREAPATGEPPVDDFPAVPPPSLWERLRGWLGRRPDHE
ncbi:MAG: hypothetical protein HY660_06010 [Armatimonadetes bacterium]|nr:hypothetical protein [Armatimonadota bacterium]